MRSRNYKAHLSVGRSHKCMTTATGVLDTGARPNLLHLRKLSSPWIERIQRIPVPTLVDAKRRPKNVMGALPLIGQIGQFKALVTFLVVTNMAVDCILGTSFIDRHVKTIYPRQRRIAFSTHHRSLLLVSRILRSAKIVNNPLLLGIICVRTYRLTQYQTKSCWQEA